MPLQNRVSPTGELFRSPARGTLMGNRGGVLHDGGREIVRAFKTRQWITCLLEFKGRKRTVMSPGLYTELFFLDEAVALAAGHRPCAECRRERFNTFRAAWTSSGAAGRLVDEIDRTLHAARTGVACDAPLDTLPDGCFVRVNEESWLVRGEALLLWSPEGYVRKTARPRGATVTVLTPLPLVRCLAEGYTPDVHPSALALSTT